MGRLYGSIREAFAILGGYGGKCMGGQPIHPRFARGRTITLKMLTFVPVGSTLRGIVGPRAAVYRLEKL